MKSIVFICERVSKKTVQPKEFDFFVGGKDISKIIDQDFFQVEWIKYICDCGKEIDFFQGCTNHLCCSFMVDIRTFGKKWG